MFYHDKMVVFAAAAARVPECPAEVTVLVLWTGLCWRQRRILSDDTDRHNSFDLIALRDFSIRCFNVPVTPCFVWNSIIITRTQKKHIKMNGHLLSSVLTVVQALATPSLHWLERFYFSWSCFIQTLWRKVCLLTAIFRLWPVISGTRDSYYFKIPKSNKKWPNSHFSSIKSLMSFC